MAGKDLSSWAKARASAWALDRAEELVRAMGPGPAWGAPAPATVTVTDRGRATDLATGSVRAMAIVEWREPGDSGTAMGTHPEKGWRTDPESAPGPRWA